MTASPVLDALALLLEPGSVAELRAIGRDGRIASGYFDDPALLAEKTDALDASAEYSGIYLTLNPVHPALLARRANRIAMRLGKKDATTADSDVLRRRWLPVDLDPVRPSGVSSTGAERDAALQAAREIRDHLAQRGWPAPLLADSGNGAHLLYRIDLPNDDAATALVRAALAALHAGFSSGAVSVDCANFNAARIWKCYGTVSRKGDSTKDRPHRRAAVLEHPSRLEIVSLEQLQALAAPADPAPPAPPAPPADRAPGFDLRAWLGAHGIPVASEKPWRGGTLYALAECPFSDAHRDGAYAVQFENGAVHAACQHESCGGGRQRWRELRERFDPPRAAPRASPPPAPPAGPDPAAPWPDPDVAATAQDVLERGDPVAYFLAAFGRDHVGDETLARCLVMSIASQAVRNTRGLHVYVTGESGKGKSSGMTAMLRQVPEEYRLAERMSNKALYYSDDIRPGTVLLLDDIALSEELQEVLKEATSKFTEPVRMRSVDKDRKVRRYTIPERCTWWLANVSAIYDDQVLNRMLTCWVDDSAAQDREVFCRRMTAVALGEDDTAGADRFDHLVCRECWRLLRADGPVTVRIPFADRIRMASHRNRRNPEVLLDLVRARALVFRLQRRLVPQDDREPAVVATEEDFACARDLFAALHTTSGSLGAKFDRNEAQVLAEAARLGVEQFTVRDVQEWTGWQYQKARRVLIGYTRKGTRYPGLLDRSPALSLVDQTVSESDREGRNVRKRALVFTFDLAVYRGARHTGEVWLEDESSATSHARDNRDDRSDERAIPGIFSPGSSNGDHNGTFENATINNPQISERDGDGGRPAPAPCSGGTDDRSRIERAELAPFMELKAAASPDGLSSPLSSPRVAVDTDDTATVDPRSFGALGAPALEKCVICGRSPSHYRELRPKGERRYLCRRCRSAAARQEQRASAPLPGAIDTASMERVAAPVGRCDVCDLEPATWRGGGVRLCEACFRRELRRGSERGDGVPASA